MMGWNDWDHMSGWGWAAASFASLVFLALVAVVAWLVTTAVRRTGNQSSEQSLPVGRDTAEQLLADRFARGEIDEEEYRRRLITLRAAASGSGRPPAGL